MQRVNLGKPYEDYIQKLVASGYYASASEVLRDALRSKMEKNNEWKKERFLKLVKEGSDSYDAGRVIPYDDNFWTEINNKVEENITNNIEIPDHVRP